MLEKDMQAQIMRWLRAQHGFFAWKAHSGGRYSEPGIPDIMCVAFGRVFAFEVKGEKGKATPLQCETIRKLNAAGACAGVVRSLDDVKAMMGGLA